MAVPVRPRSAGTDGREGSDPTTLVQVEGTRTIVQLQGEWDYSTRAILADVLSKVIESDANDVVIDLSVARFVDTAAVRTLFEAQQILNGRGRTLTYRSPSRVVAQILHLFGLTNLIEGKERQRAQP